MGAGAPGSPLVDTTHLLSTLQTKLRFYLIHYLDQMLFLSLYFYKTNLETFESVILFIIITLGSA